jgi:hypothetical protein
MGAAPKPRAPRLRPLSASQRDNRDWTIQGVYAMEPVKNGPAAAAILAAGIGCAALGILTMSAAASPAIAGLLAWSEAVGPLSGKAGLTTLIWLAAWLLLGLLWKNRQVSLRRTLAWTYLGIANGFLGTFPPIYERL